MSLISRLPKYIVLPILIDWLEPKELCLLDSAICNTLERHQFLNLVGHENIKFIGLEMEFSQSEYLKWTVMRNLQITNLVLKYVGRMELVESLTAVLSYLKVLVIHRDIRSSGPGFICIINCCPQLEELHLSNCEVINNNTIKLIADQCPLLKKVYFPCLSHRPNSTSNKSMCYFIEHCKDLEVFVVRWMRFDLLSFQTLCNVDTNLTELTLSGIVSKLFNKSDVAQFTEACQPLGTRLTVLRLINLNISRERMQIIATSCPLLTELDLSLSRTCLFLENDTGMLSKHLTELNVSYCYGLTMTIVGKILTTCLNLKTLYAYFFHCHGDTPYWKTIIPEDTKLELFGMMSFGCSPYCKMQHFLGLEENTRIANGNLRVVSDSGVIWMDDVKYHWV